MYTKWEMLYIPLTSENHVSYINIVLRQCDISMILYMLLQIVIKGPLVFLLMIFKLKT